MSGISTHVLDISLGKPAAGVGVKLLRARADEWVEVAGNRTDEDGRCRELLPADEVAAADYRVVFDTGSYFHSIAVAVLYPEVCITFHVGQAGASYHLPLLLSPNGYTTYRGT